MALAKLDGARRVILTHALSLIVLTLAAVAPSTYSYAQAPVLSGSSYITPFPQTERYQLRVIGDWLGTGLTPALQDAFKQEASLQIADASRSNFGLARADQNDLYGEIDRMISSGPVQIVVIMLGINDRQSMRTATSRVQPGTPEWKEAYGKEAEKLIKKLKSANIAVYWVGLPVMGNPNLNETVAAMNDAVRQAAYLNGVKFIETWAGFTDQLGSYSAYGPDLMGQTRRLREGDGIGLTNFGYRKLASYVETILRRDLAQARSQRNIPLAGDEEEQARVVPHPTAPAKSAEGNEGKKEVAVDAMPLPSSDAPAKDTPAKKANPANNPAAADPTPSGGASWSATSSSRRDQAAFSAGFQQGEFILNDLGNGLTAIAVISPINEFSIRDIQRQTPLGDRIYFRVLSKGEALPPKEGRADDFRWQGNPSQTQ